MTERITSGQKKQLKRFIEDAIDRLDISVEAAQRAISNGGLLQAKLLEAVCELANEYVTPFAEADVPEQYQATLAKYRRLATEWGVSPTTPVCYRVRAGFTLKSHAPKVGPCWEDFQYLQGWNFPDQPTQDCLVFWVPRLVPESTGKSVQEQIKLFGQIRTEMELPEHHLSSFGTVSLLAGLILACFKATDEQVPQSDLWTRTDTCDADGYRIYLRWRGGQLYCGPWDWVEGRYDAYLGGFALGVETLGC